VWCSEPHACPAHRPRRGSWPELLPSPCLLRDGSGNRERQFQTRALAQYALHQHTALVLIHNPVHQREPKASTAFFRRKERVKDLVQVLLRDARASVFKHDFDGLAFRLADTWVHPSRSEEHTSELQSPCNLVC